MNDAEKGELLKVLYVTIFLNSTGLGTCTFLLPVFAETLGASYTDLGVIGAVGNVAYTVITLMSGYLLDRFERVRLYLLFTLGAAATIALFTLASTVQHLTVMRALMGVFSATFWVSASTLTADISPRESLTQSMGRYNLAWIAGFTVGPLVGGMISSAYGFHTLFAALASLLLLSLIVSLTRVRGRVELRRESSGDPGGLGSLRSLALSYATLLPFTLVLGIYMAIMPGHMSVAGLSASLIGFLLTMTNGVRGVVFMNVRRLVEWGTLKSIAAASLLLAASMYLARSAGGLSGFAVPLFLYGVGSGIMTPVVLDFITRRASKNSLGSAMGVHEGVYGVGMCVGPFVGGMVADTYGAPAMYGILVAVSLLVLPLGYAMTAPKKTGEPTSTL
ncbi:MFS transporter [Candidatus Bathyarchaeota archaeon]|nr:MFS transporter [Candidatus Bathyarchaeota archaeon]